MSKHCFFCGNLVGAEGCSLCGTVRNARDERRVRAPCPRCGSEARLVPFGVGEAALQACPRCKGMFVSAVDWDTLLDVFWRDTLPDILVPDAEGPSVYGPYRSAPSSKNPVQVDREADVRCPTCHGAMERLEFAAMTHVVIDVCATHGVWLDAGELEGIIATVHPHRPQTKPVVTAPPDVAYGPTPEAAREPRTTTPERATFVPPVAEWKDAFPPTPTYVPPARYVPAERQANQPWTAQLGRALGHLLNMIMSRKRPT